MPEFLRVKDKTSGHEYTIPSAALDEDAQTVIDKPAVDATGPLPTKHKTSVGSAGGSTKPAGQKAASTKENG